MRWHSQTRMQQGREGSQPGARPILRPTDTWRGTSWAGPCWRWYWYSRA
ncbi:hypothetical protein [Lysobacter gummosus]